MLGSAAIGIYLLGLFIWRLNTVIWLSLKFGPNGPCFFVYLAMVEALLAHVIVRRRSARQRFMECYKEDKVPVVLCILLGHLMMVSF